MGKLKILFKKAISVLQKKGFVYFVKAVFTHGFQIINGRLKYSVRRRSYVKFFERLDVKDRVFLWTEHFGWNIPLFQRPQHIARCLAQKDCTYFYYTVPQFDPDVEDYKQLGPNLYLVNRWNSVFVAELEKFFDRINCPKYIHTYSTLGTTKEELEHYVQHGFHVLYEYVDDLSPELSGTKEIPKYLLDKYNYVTGTDQIPVAATADLLVQQMRQIRGDKNLVQSSNGVDPAHFRAIKENFVFSDVFQKVLDRGNKIVGYYGAMAKWLDYDLLKEVAAKLPDVDFVLVGKKYDESYDASGIEAVPNIHFIGPVAFQELPQYAAKFDVCTIPFVVNSITNATSPLKLFEYMALRKPVLTTAMKESSKYAAVNIATGAEEFAQKLQQLLAYTPENQPAYFELLDKIVDENAWEAKADLILDMLAQYEASV